MLSILKFCLFFLIASDEVPRTYTAEELNEKTGYFVLLATAPAACSVTESALNCEKTLIYEQGAEQVHYLVVDSRDNKEGSFNVNEVLKSPETYEGEIKTYTLSEQFVVTAPYDTVNAQFNKDNSVTIKVRKDNQEHNKTLTP